ncbi:MAG TPA: hypothetical protein VFU27_10145 [Terriglobales bacterium]|nr:hypothetical protein [Terriglobales bacterium]
MRWMFLLCVLLAVTYAGAQSKLQTFTSRDGAFTFRYSSRLVECEQKPAQRGAWGPAQSCSAVAPVCDDLSSPATTTVACIAYPKNAQERTNLQAAAFSVAEDHAAGNAKACLSSSPDWAPDQKALGKKVINGQRFQAFETSEVAMGTGLESRIYRSFRNGECYSLAVRTAWSNPGNFDPGAIRVLTRKQEREISDQFDEVLQSFRFKK